MLGKKTDGNEMECFTIEGNNLSYFMYATDSGRRGVIKKSTRSSDGSITLVVLLEEVVYGYELQAPEEEIAITLTSDDDFHSTLNANFNDERVQDYEYICHDYDTLMEMCSNGSVGQQPAGDGLYRCRLSFDDPKSQIGAFSSLENAINLVDSIEDKEYKVYDSLGNQVYP